jgi:hypothetical protein
VSTWGKSQGSKKTAGDGTAAVSTVFHMAVFKKEGLKDEKITDLAEMWLNDIIS